MLKKILLLCFICSAAGYEWSEFQQIFGKQYRPVFPSFYNEGVPRSLMEAASMELPIITTMNRGCKEVVLNNETGFTCKLNDPVDLAYKMDQMIRLSSKEREQMGKKGRALVIAKFDMEMVIQNYLQTLGRELKN